MKRILPLLFALTLLGCSQRPTASQNATAMPAAQPQNATALPASTTRATISFMISGDAAEKAAYEQLVTAFKQRRPDIELQLIHIPGDSDYRKRMAIDFAAGSPADIVLINYRRYADFAARNALEPIGPYLDKSNLIKQSDFYPTAIEAFIWQGTLTCLPQNLSSLVVYYNQDLFKAAGLDFPRDDWTWDDMLNAAKKLTRDLDGDGRIEQYGLGSDVAFLRVAPFIWQNGGEIVDNPQSPKSLTLTRPETRAAIQWFIELQTVQHVMPDAATEASEPGESRFMNGRMAMFLNSRRAVPTYRQITGFAWDVAPLPRGRQQASVLHADAYCMAKASKNKDAAWAFIEFANSVEGQRIIASTGRTVPSLRSVAQSEAFLDPNALPHNSKVFLSATENIRAVPVMKTWPAIEEILDEELQRAFYGQASLDEVLTTATRRTAPLFGP